MSDSKYVAKISPRNNELLQSLESDFADTNMLLFTDYRGLNMIQTQELRSVLKKEGAFMRVVKNRIALRALSKEHNTDDRYSALLSGPTAIVCSNTDNLEALKILLDFKKTHGLPHMKGAVIRNTVYDAEQIAKIATLPSRYELLAQLLYVTQAPVQQFTQLLSTLISRPLTVLSEIAKKK